MEARVAQQVDSSWFRRDLLRGCKTGEVIEAEPRTLAQKLRAIALCVALGAPAILGAQWFYKVWVPHRYAELDALAKVDPAAGARQLAEFISWLLLQPVLFCLVACIAVAIHASRLVRAGRRPLPGTKVRRRTEVVAGWWCVRLPAILWGALALACLFAVWWCYVELVAMFWNGYLDKTVAAAESGVAARPPSILPRFDIASARMKDRPS